MPIAVEVVPAAQFAAWVGSKGGHLPGANAPVTGAATPATAAGTGSSTDTVTPAPASAGTAANPNPTPAPNNKNVANRTNQ
jgi:cytochrome c oxidase subunit 2